jgi:DNA-directed RNA polymerase beta subunit
MLIQHHSQIPLVTTLTNYLTPANGFNVIVAYMCYNYNQEDSIIIN